MIEELIDALEKLQDAKHEYNEAVRNCKQENQSYFCSREIRLVNEAKNELALVFQKAVQEAVDEHLKKL